MGTSKRIVTLVGAGLVSALVILAQGAEREPGGFLWQDLLPFSPEVGLYSRDFRVTDDPGLGFTPGEAAEAGPELRVELVGLIPQLKAIFLEQGIPPGLIWIAEVESAWAPDAVSRSGAVGLFQLMPATAARFGLKSGEGDERSCPLRSAEAAALYLRILYQQFGSWPLAIAAFNAGEGCVSRTLMANRATTYAEIAPFLPEQTQDYVPRVMDLIVARQLEWRVEGAGGGIATARAF